MMPRTRALSWLLLLSAGALGSCESSGGQASASPANPVQHEMQLLHAALRDSVTAIANGTVSTIPGSIHRVHEAKQATAAAISAGRYAPPSGAADLARFSQLDEAFHGELVALVKAAQSGDVPATGRALGNVMSRCQECHEQFRFRGSER